MFWRRRGIRFVDFSSVRPPEAVSDPRSSHSITSSARRAVRAGVMFARLALSDAIPTSSLHRKVCRKHTRQSSDSREREFSAQNTTRRTTMIGSKTLAAAALLSTIAVSSASAQLPPWASEYPDAFQAEYPNRDVLNGGALTPAGRMGLELPGGAAPVYGANSAYAATVGASPSSCARHYHSCDPASGTFLGHDGRRHACE